MTLYAGQYIRSKVGKTIKSSKVSHLWELWEGDEMFSIRVFRRKFPKKITVHAELVVREMKTVLELVVRNHSIRIVKKKSCFELRVDGINFCDLPVYNKNKKTTESFGKLDCPSFSIQTEQNPEIADNLFRENANQIDLLTEGNETERDRSYRLSQIHSNVQIILNGTTNDATNAGERYSLPDSCLGMTPTFDFYPKPNINPFFTGNQFLPRFKK